ncbi:MAG: carboxypeptidase [Rhodothermales bacterium]|nr:carboxypeptidase [Rhodothermales bacterium]
MSNLPKCIAVCTCLLATSLATQVTSAQKRELPVDTTISSRHEVTVNGKKVPYVATVGTQPVYGEDGEPVASLFYTFYERSDITDRSRRPLFISFNGGPGSGSLWMHLGYTSPKQLIIDDEGYPVQPYGVRDNPHSIIDVADIVYVNPVNTGFSRILGEAEREQFFGVNEDVAYLAGWIDTFISRRKRWTSPKYLIGESYGTTRVSGLAGKLQGSHWMYLNGVILVSPTGLGIDRGGPVGRALYLPYFAAAAWYHKRLAPELQSRDLEDLLPEVETFTLDKFIPALSRGGFINDEEKRTIAAAVARYAGVSETFVLDNNLAVGASSFWKELLRDEGYTVGRLDSRYRGIDRSNAGDRYDYPAELTSWNHAFAPAINHYLRDVLGFDTDLRYYLFGPVHPWNRERDDTGENLRQAVAENPFLHVMLQSGYYDGATDYFSAKYTMWNLDPSGRLSDRLRFKAYRSGHMMYLRKEDLKSSNDHIREFIRDSMPAEGEPARY